MNNNNDIEIYAALWHQFQLTPVSPRRNLLLQLQPPYDVQILHRYFAPREIETAVNSFEKALGAEIHFVTKFCPHYPSMLIHLLDAPPVLYFRGCLKSSLGVAVVGSRNPSRYGSEVASMISGQISRLGLTVVSGLARGIDSIAHAVALRFRPSESSVASTVAVIGSGLREIYPRENFKLSEEIVESGGCVLSELPPLTKARPHYFPLRNRIISGLSEATVIVEARERSGSLITARTALEQGRDVLVVPGKIDSESFRGSNTLLRDGARPYLDITDLFASLSKNKLSEAVTGNELTGVKNEIPISVTVEESFILSALGESEELTVEHLAEHAGLPAQLTAASVTSLVMKRLVKELPGARFVRAAARERGPITDPSS